MRPAVAFLVAVLVALPAVVFPGRAFADPYERFVFEGHPVLFQAGAAPPRGIVFLFHGSGGGVGFIERVHTRSALAPMLAAGYAVVATESAQRSDPKRWDARGAKRDSNADLPRLFRLHAHLVSEHGLPPRTPVFTMGMSNGAFMAMLFAGAAADAGLPVKAVAAYQGGFAAPVLAESRYRIPTFYVLVENDTRVDNARIGTGCDYIKGLEVPCHVELVAEGAIEASHLTGEGLTAEAAADVLTRLQRAGWIDGNGRRQTELVDREDMFAALAPMGFADPRTVFNALRSAWAFHYMRGEFGDEQLVFFESQLQTETVTSTSSAACAVSAG